MPDGRNPKTGQMFGPVRTRHLPFGSTLPPIRPEQETNPKPFVACIKTADFHLIRQKCALPDGHWLRSRSVESNHGRNSGRSLTRYKPLAHHWTSWSHLKNISESVGLQAKSGRKAEAKKP